PQSTDSARQGATRHARRTKKTANIAIGPSKRNLYIVLIILTDKRSDTELSLNVMINAITIKRHYTI
ncbi:hypothetical protein, partial [Buttiauxella warmboldiae]|uniref:hypothetical protein n=1 Tax=Buttiauxella warmboldiae TaxID=82993 RepID=UPI001ABF450E